MLDNLKETLQYVVELANKEDKIVKDEKGTEWTSHNLNELNPKKYPDTLFLSTLDSLIDYFNSNINGIADQRTMVVVDNPREVYVYTENDELETTTMLIRVEASLPSVSYEKFMSSELFNIELQSKYVNEYDRQDILEFASSILIEDNSSIEDDGVSQITTVKKGVASRDKVRAPNPVVLAPYRTFLEVDQPMSEFILRLNDDANLALFEADGGAWKLHAVNNIKDYLLENLGDLENVFVLA